MTSLCVPLQISEEQPHKDPQEPVRGDGDPGAGAIGALPGSDGDP